MTSVESIIMNALKKNGGSADLQQIYTFVNLQLGKQEKILKDYRHTVRGVVYRLKKQGKITKTGLRNATYSIKNKSTPDS